MICYQNRLWIQHPKAVLLWWFPCQNQEIGHLRPSLLRVEVLLIWLLLYMIATSVFTTISTVVFVIIPTIVIDHYYEFALAVLTCLISLLAFDFDQ